MAPSMSKMTSSSIDFIRRKQGKNSRDVGGGRLMIGWREQDWTPVWYEPVDGTGVETESPDMALFKFDNPHGTATAREPMEGEVAWLPQFDPARCPSKNRKERLILQKRFLNAAWRYCAERDLDRVAELEEELDDPLHRKWTSWFDIAKRWKSSDVKRRKATFEKRKKTAADAGINLKDADINDDDSDDDSAIGDLDNDHEMPPPARPRPRPSGGGGGSGAAAPRPSANGRKRPGTSAKTAAKKTCGSSSSQTSSTGSQYIMSGGLGSRGSSGSRDDDDDTMSVDYDARHPSPAPGRQVVSGYTNNPMLTPLTQRQRVDSRAPDGGLPLFKDWVAPDGGRENSIGAYRVSPLFEPEADRQRLSTFNGREDEDEAYADAMRASVQPENMPGHDDEGEFPGGVQRSIEPNGQNGGQ